MTTIEIQSLIQDFDAEKSIAKAEQVRAAKSAKRAANAPSLSNIAKGLIIAMAASILLTIIIIF